MVEDLARDKPGLFKKLVTIPVQITKDASGSEYNFTTVIKLENRPQIFWNYYRIVKNTAEISDMCEDFFQYLRTREASGDLPEKKFHSGDAYFLNDRLFLHGRGSFIADSSGDRRILQSMWHFM